MGKGDRKTKKGKISMGSFGVRRRKKDNSIQTAIVKKKASAAKPKAKAKKATATKAKPKVEKADA